MLHNKPSPLAASCSPNNPLGVVIQPEEKRYDWSAYDRIVDACQTNGIEILATLGGHFDRPPVPAWAGSTLAEVVKKNPAALEAFMRAWVQRYQGRMHYYEILNEPKVHHQGLTEARRRGQPIVMG